MSGRQKLNPLATRDRSGDASALGHWLLNLKTICGYTKSDNNA